MKEFAKQYYELGLNPTCISYIKTKYNVKENNPEKSPCHAWKRWQVSRPNINEIMQLSWEVSNGIGAVLGHSTRCIDIDYCNDYEFVKDFLKTLGLPSNYSWVVKSPNGFHIHLKSESIYFASHNELVDGVLPVYPNGEYASVFSKIELRWANHIVLPPTIINGQKYKFINDEIPTHQPAKVDMFNIFRALSKFCGNFYREHGNFEAQKMVFQLGVPSEGYPYAEAAYCSKDNEVIKSITHSSGYIAFNKLPKSSKVGYLEFGATNDSSYPIYNWDGELPFFIDIETTGLINNEFDYDNYPRIIQIAYYNSFKSEFKTHYIKPENFTVPSEIERLTGISNDFLEKNGKKIEDVLRSIDIPKGAHIVGHNLDFDLSVLDSEYLRYFKHTQIRLIAPHRNGHQTFCTMKKFASIFNVKYPKLSEMYTYFFDDLPKQRMHDAENDLKVLIDCYNIMCLYGYIKMDYENQRVI